MININEPTSYSNIQPDYTKVATFPGFAFYHSLKEWYVIKSSTNIRSYPDYSLDKLNLKGSYAFLIGNNKEHIYTGQCETASLSKIKVDPNTGDILTKEIKDLKEIATSLDNALSNVPIAITSGLVYKDNVVIGLTVGNQHKSYILYSSDNAQTFNINQIQTSNFITPTGIARINFYDTFFYIFFCNSFNEDSYYLYSIKEEDLYNNLSNITFVQSFDSGRTFGDSKRKHINRQLIWNHNTLLTLSDDRRKVLALQSNLNSKEVKPFQEIQYEVTNSSFTQIEKIKDNNYFTKNTNVFLKHDSLTTDSNNSTQVINYAKRIKWDTVNNSIASTNKYVINCQPINEDSLVIFGVEDQSNNTYKTYIEKVNVNPYQLVKREYVNYIPMSQYNTGSKYWNGEIRNNVTSILPKAKSISHNANTSTINYGNQDFVYDLILDVYMPLDGNLEGKIVYDNYVDSIKVDGTTTGITYSTGNGGDIIHNISLPLTEGQHTVIFTIRNQADSNTTGNPTSLTIAWDPLELNNEKIDYNDLIIHEDKIYAVNNNIAKVIDLETLEVLSSFDLENKPLVEDPDNPPLVKTGVDPNSSRPIQWKCLEYFGDVFIYNSKHEDTFTNASSKTFYMWKIVDSSPAGRQMFSTFDLDINVGLKLQYFYDGINELHVLISSRISNSVSSNIRTTQYRVSGLANYNQVSQSPKLVGTMLFQNIDVANNGEINITQKSPPGSTSNPGNLYVYVNPGQGGASLETNSYSIAKSSNNNPLSLANSINLESRLPSTYNNSSIDNYGNAWKYVTIPGDYNASNIVSSVNIYDEENNVLDNQLGNSNNSNISLSLSSNEVIINSFYSKEKKWTYFLILDTVSYNYKLVRSKSVYYLN